MTFTNKSCQLKFSMVGAALLPLVYVVFLIILKDPDFLESVLGPFGFIIWIVQWIPFFIGGWPLAIMTTILFLALLGHLLGKLFDWVIKRGEKTVPVIKKSLTPDDFEMLVIAKK